MSKTKLITYKDFEEFFKDVPKNTPFYSERFGKYIVERICNDTGVFFRVIKESYTLNKGEAYIEYESGNSMIIDHVLPWQ